MKKKMKIHDGMDKVLENLEQEGYADFTIGQYRQSYNGLLKFITGKDIWYFSDELAVDYIKDNRKRRLNTP